MAKRLVDKEIAKFDATDAVRVNIDSPNETDGSVPVTIKGGSETVETLPPNNVVSTASLLSNALQGQDSIKVTGDTTGFVDGALIILTNTDDQSKFVCYQVGDLSASTADIDRDLDTFWSTASTVVTAGHTGVRIDGGNGRFVTLNSRGHQEVEIASQISPPFLSHFYKLNNGWTTTTALAVVEANVFTVADATAASVGNSIIVSDVVNARFYIAHVLAVAGLNITVDQPIDFPYASGSDVAFASHEMNVTGSLASPVVFGIRLAEPPASLQTTIQLDITRVLNTMITSSLGDLTDFGDISGGLTNGVVLRKKYSDGTFGNIVNIKSNADYAAFAYDFDRYIASNPGIGINGQKWRLTFGGEEKMGTVIRVGPAEDLQWVVQDDLSSLTEFTNIAEGALVAD